MSAGAASKRERRVLVLAPTRRDGALTTSILTDAGIACVTVAEVCDLVGEIAQGAAAAIVAEEAVGGTGFDVLLEALTDQPSWSDLPLLLLTHPGADTPIVASALERFPNATLLERPMRVATLVSAVRAALKARERQYQIRAQIDAIADANRRKDEFLATLAHELRNPLAPIRNSVYMLKLGSHPDPQIRHMYDVLDRQVNHMVRLVDDLMEVSRITRNKIALHMQPLDLSAVIRSAIETSQPLIDRARHRLHVSLPTERLIVHGDAVRLAQVFSNLLNNAAKYSPDAGEIWVTAAREDGHVRISVRDRGVGIPADHLPRVFDIFAQAPGASERAQGGLGIGLALVRSLVRMHHGSVNAASEGAGRGSEFVVRLPLCPQDAPAASPDVRLDRVSLKRRVLVVDDNQDAAETTAALLSCLGAEVEVVHDGRRALDLVQQNPPGVVLLDLGMPEIDGYEVARRIRADRTLDGVTLVALTGWSQEEDRRRTRAAGFDHHLVKPVEVASLQRLLQAVDLAKPAVHL